jgi:hypothetical protein
MTDPSCSQQSCDVGETLAGTAADADRWLLLEYSNEWKPKGYDHAQLPEETRATIDAAVAANPRIRVQLIRRAERRVGETGVRLFLARAERTHEQLWEFSLPDHESIATLDLSAWARGSDPFVSAHRNAPLYIVCVHGKRDRCCALKGTPVYRRMSELRPEETWQTTHLGGHRFAATLACLPAGICYGRVEENEVEALINAHEHGDLYNLERYRGRSCDNAITQAGEMLLRQGIGLMRIDALRPTGAVSDTTGTKVTFQTADFTRHEVAVAHEATVPIQQSCDAPDRRPAQRLIRT